MLPNLYHRQGIQKNTLIQGHITYYENTKLSSYHDYFRV